MLPSLPLPKKLLPWVLLALSLAAVAWATVAGRGPLVGLGILGAVVALTTLVGSRIVDPEAASEHDERE